MGRNLLFIGQMTKNLYTSLIFMDDKCKLNEGNTLISTKQRGDDNLYLINDDDSEKMHVVTQNYDNDDDDDESISFSTGSEF